MGSNIFTAMGLGNLDLGLVIIILAVLLIAVIVLLIITIVKNNKLQDKYNKFMQGSKAISLEDQIQNLAQNVEILNEESAIHSQDLDTIFKKHESSFQKMGLTKYDAFKEMGGKLSYALTVLDENNNGFLINSVHSSSGCYSYTKRIKQGACDLDLSKEEQDSLNKAISQ